MELKAYQNFPAFLSEWHKEHFSDDFRRNILNRFLDSKVIIFEGPVHSNDYSRLYSNHIDDKYIIDPPFKNCWFEAPGEKALFSFNLETKEKGIAETVQIYGMLLEEWGPQFFLVHALAHIEVINKVMILSSEVGTSSNPITIESMKKLGKDSEFKVLIDNGFNSMVPKMLNKIHSSDVGEEKLFKTIQFKTKSGTIRHKLNSIIRIGKRSQNFIPIYGDRTREIDWSNRWWTRGHWRRLEEAEKLGKNRDGEYIIKGFTWVTEHIKGPEDKPIINQLRVVKEH